MSCVVCKDINLIFQLHQQKRIKELFMPGVSKFSEFEQGKQVHALKNINITLHEGDRLSIIGSNGAGKSTFLRVLAGIYRPTSGTLRVSGSIAGMFEFATGFEMEQNGWDNIYLRGLMLGCTPNEILGHMAEIAEFSELGNYLNMPVKYYSSGMLIRLAFSVSTAIQPDVLLLDEAMAAGDAAFIDKAQNRMKKMMDTSKVLVLVTHSMASANDLCNRCIWLEKGIIVMEGKPQEVTQAYLDKAQNKG